MKRIWRYETISRFLDQGTRVEEARFDAMHGRVAQQLSHRFSVAIDGSQPAAWDFHTSRYVDPCSSISLVASLSGCSRAAFDELLACAGTLDEGFYISIDATGDNGQAYLIFFRTGEVWGYSESRKAAETLHRFGFPKHPILG